MITKNSVLTTLEEMPERFSVDEFLDRLIFLHKIEEGRVYKTAEARQKLKQLIGTKRKKETACYQ